MKSSITYIILLSSFNCCCLTFAFTILQPFSLFTQLSKTTTTNNNNTNTGTKSTPTKTTTILFAEKKKRRRRKTSPSSEQQNQEFDNNDNYNEIEDELPEFDLDEESELNASIKESSSISSSSNSITSKTTVDSNDPSVIAAMQATNLSSSSSSSSSSSTKDLLRSRNRELEQKFVVNEITEDLPSFSDYNAKKGRNVNVDGSSSSTSSNSNLGKKAMRREQRRAAAALEARNNQQDEESDAFSQLLNKLPFISSSNKDGGIKEEKSIIKLLEEGTWACIYILVAWELYINSPFFERSAPMAPVVFQDPVTMTFLL